MKKTILLIFILGMCIIADADSQKTSRKIYQTGNELYPNLSTNVNGKEEDFDSLAFRLYATGYIAGVHDAGNGIYFYTPEEATVDQLRAIVKKYFENHPEKLHLAASSLIMMAFKEAFPIKETPTFPESANDGNRK